MTTLVILAALVQLIPAWTVSLETRSVGADSAVSSQPDLTKLSHAIDVGVTCPTVSTQLLRVDARDTKHTDLNGIASVGRWISAHDLRGCEAIGVMQGEAFCQTTLVDLNVRLQI